MKAEVEGILLWAFEGLQRLAANNFKFTESDRTRDCLLYTSDVYKRQAPAGRTG